MAVKNKRSKDKEKASSGKAKKNGKDKKNGFIWKIKKIKKTIN